MKYFKSPGRKAHFKFKVLLPLILGHDIVHYKREMKEWMSYVMSLKPHSELGKTPKKRAVDLFHQETQLYLGKAPEFKVTRTLDIDPEFTGM